MAVHHYILVALSVIVASKIYIKLTTGICKCKTKLTGKVVIVTGANTGIGYETAKDLACRGAKVIIACRDREKGIAARDTIITETQNSNVVFKQLNLSSFQSVRKFAEDILKTEQEIHILVNNAGTGVLDNSLTEDGVAIEAQVNHFAPFLLTMLILPVLKKSAPSRIINVASVMHKFGKFDPNIFGKVANGVLGHRRVYSDTKLANILFTKKLSQKLEGTGVTVNSLHPGAVNSDIFRNQPRISRFFISLVFKSNWEGAQTTIYLAVSPDVEIVTGKYFAECKEASPTKNAEDQIAADQLWDLSNSVVKGNF